MAKKIQIDIEVNGKMQKATVSTKKLKQALDGAKQSQDQLNTSTRTGYRAFQGTAQNTANSTKAFAKQAGVVGGLVPIYASIAANVFAISAAFGVLSRNAAVQQLETSLTNTGIAAGKNLPAVAEGLRNITGAAISTEAALRATAIATSSGFSTSQLQGLTKVATGASIALGRNLPDALDRLVRGTAKLEPEILDELGIIVRLDQATRDYAGQLGKTAGELTQFERQQAFLNATITQGLNKYQRIAQTVNPNPYDRLAAAFDDLTKTSLEFLNKGLTPIVEFLSKSDFALGGALGLIGTTILGQIIPTISEFSAASTASFAQAARAAKISAARITNEYTIAAKKIQVLDFMPKTYKNLAVSLKAGTASTKDYQKALTSLKISQGRRTAEIKKATLAQKELSGFQLKASQQFLKTKTAELAAIEAQIAATQNLAIITARGATTTVVGGGSVAKAQKKAGQDRRRAIGSRVEKRTLDKIENSSSLGSIGAAAGGLALLMQNIGRTEGAIPKLSEAFRSLGSAGKFVGAVFSRLLLPLSLLSIAFSLFGPAIEKFIFKTNELDKKLEEIAKSFDKTARIIQFFKKEMMLTINPVTKQTRSLEVMAGITDTTAGAFARLQAETEKLQVKDLNDAIDTLIEKETKLAAAEEKLSNATNGTRLRRTINARDAQEEFDAAEKSVEGLLDKLGKVDKSKALVLLQRNMATLRASGAFKVFPELAQEYQILRDELSRGPDLVDLDEYTKKTEKLSEPWRMLRSGIEAAQDAQRRFDEETAKLGRRQQTPFSPAIDASKEFQKELGGALDAFVAKQNAAYAKVSNLVFRAPNFPLAQFEAEFEGATEQARNIERALKGTSAELKESIKDTNGLKNGIATYNNFLSETEASLINVKSLLAEQLNLQKRVTKLSSMGAGLGLSQSIQEERVNKQKIKSLEVQQLMNKLLIKDAEVRTAVNDALEVQINTLENIDNTNEQTFLKVKDKVALMKEETALLQKNLNVAKESNSIAERADKLALSKANRERSRNRFSGSADEKAALEQRIALEEANLARKTAFIQAEANMKKANIALEFMLLDAKYKFLADETAKLQRELRNPTDKNGNIIEPSADAIKLANSLDNTINSYTKLKAGLGLDEIKVTIGEDGSLNIGGMEEGGLLSQIFGNIDAGASLSLAELQDRIVGLKTELLDVEPISKALDGVANQLQDGLGGALGDVIDGTKKAKDAFGDLALSIIKSFRDMMLDEAVNMVFNMMRDNAKENPDGFFGKMSSFFNKKSAEDSSTTTTTPPVTTTPTAVTQASTVTPTIGGAMTGGVDGMGLGASIGNPLFVTIVDNPMAAIAGAAPGAEGAAAGAVPGAAPATGDPQTEAINKNTEATSKLTLNTASMVTGTLAMVAGLTGNEKAAMALAAITAALQVAQMIQTLTSQADTAVKATNTGVTAVNTGMIAGNTAALTANTAATLAAAAVPFRNGGIATPPGYSSGGIAKGAQAGYPVTLHGTEAVVPLPNGKSIPVEMSGAAGGMQQNNVSVNVVMNSDGTSETNSEQDSRQSEQLGKNIARAVQAEIQNQKRPGGMLSPYGAI